MNLDQCLEANRAFIFVVTDNDTDVLCHINQNYPNNIKLVYSTTLADLVYLDHFLKPDFNFKYRRRETLSTIEVLDRVLTGNTNISEKYRRNSGFLTLIMLDCDAYIWDPQVIRKLKDIILRYQINEDFTVNIVCISHKVCVPPQLERLSEVVFFDLPNEVELKKLSDNLAGKLELTGDRAPSLEVVNNLKGLTTFEVEQAYLQSYCLFNKIKLEFIRDFKKSAIAKTELLSLSETKTTFDDIGGLDRLKAWLLKSAGGWTVEGKDFGLPLLKGVLLIGVAGCGKSLIAKSLGNEWKLPVISFDPGTVFSSRVGDSESNMRRALQIIDNLAPCILLIDEVEKALSGLQSSSYSDSGVTARVIRNFLVWMQDSTKPVFTIATANNIKSMPPEMISRFDETFFVGLPQTNERKDIFEIHIKKLGRDPDKFNLDCLAEESQNLSGREIEQVIREAMYDSFYAGIELKTETIRHVLKNKVSLIATMAEELKELIEWVGWDESKQDGIRARYASTTNPTDNDRIKHEINKLLSDIGSS